MISDWLAAFHQEVRVVGDSVLRHWRDVRFLGFQSMLPANSNNRTQNTQSPEAYALVVSSFVWPGVANAW